MRRAKKEPGTSGVLRVDARASRLTPRLRAGDIAVLDLVDLDSATAQTLVARGVAAVINAAPSSSGRYPNLGPDVLVSAGVPLLDAVGPAVLTDLREGRRARLDGDTLWVDGDPVVTGVRQDQEQVGRQRELARSGVAAQLADALGGAQTFLVDERDLVLDGAGLPALPTGWAGRHVLVVGPLPGADRELRQLRRYRRRYRPVVVGVDGGADTVLRAKLPLSLAVGDPATMTETALRAAEQVVVPDGCDGLERVQDLAVPVLTCASRAAPEDLALLLLRDLSPPAVVGAGLPMNLDQMLDRGREGAASGFVTRVAVGATLLSAQAAVTLTPRRSAGLPVLCMLLAAALGVSGWVGHDALWTAWRDLGR